jgi:hypothetical protein
MHVQDLAFPAGSFHYLFNLIKEIHCTVEISYSAPAFAVSKAGGIDESGWSCDCLTVSRGVMDRHGLNTRSYAQSDQAQVIMEIGQYDVDHEIEGLRTSVSRLKEVR